jgi:hypothetical protein
VSKKITFRQAVPADAERLLADIRHDDLVEINCCHDDPLKVIADGIAMSEKCWAAEEDGHLLAVFGVAGVKDHAEIGVPWLIGTELLGRRGKLFKMYGKQFIESMKEGRKILYNVVHSKNLKSIRWLESLGFFVNRESGVSVNGHSFYSFEMRAA